MLQILFQKLGKMWIVYVDRPTVQSINQLTGGKVEQKNNIMFVTQFSAYREIF